MNFGFNYGFGDKFNGGSAPVVVPDPLLEYDFSDSGNITTSGGELTGASDISGNGNFLSCPSGGRPAYGARTINSLTVPDFDKLNAERGIINVDGNNRIDGLGLYCAPAQGSFAMYMVADPDTDGAFIAKAVSTTSSRTFQFYRGTSPAELAFIIRGTSTNITSGYAGGLFAIWFKYDAVLDKAYYKLNDDSSFTELTIGTASENTGEGIYLGGRTGGTSFNYDGAMGAVKIWNTSLTDAQFDVEGQAEATKWGFTYTNLVSAGGIPTGPLTFGGENLTFGGSNLTFGV